MGSISEYINGYRGRRSVYNYDSPRFNPRTGRLSSSGNPVQVYGVEANVTMLVSLMTEDTSMAAAIRKMIRDALKKGRSNLTKDARDYLDSDPRKAARAVKYAVYKTVFGGNFSILQKKKGTAGAKYDLVRQRKVEQNPKMRGGNRRPRIEGRNRLDYYYGADRGFILRFISSGTVNRTSRFGNRGSIGRRDWFGRTAPWQMEAAAKEVAEAINEYVRMKQNG